jgi:hypothetical protein
VLVDQFFEFLVDAVAERKVMENSRVCLPEVSCLDEELICSVGFAILF